MKMGKLYTVSYLPTVGISASLSSRFSTIGINWKPA